MRMLPAPIWPLAQHATFGQNCFDVSIGSAVLFCIHTTCQRTSSFSSISPFFTTYWGCTIVLIILSILGYIFNWDWTGLGSYVSPPHPKDSDFQRSKTLWDWFNLLGVLAIPIVVGFGVAWYTTQQGKVADAENKDNQRENAFQTYINKMSEFLLKYHLQESEKEHEILRKIARVQTL